MSFLLLLLFLTDSQSPVFLGILTYKSLPDATDFTDRLWPLLPFALRPPPAGLGSGFLGLLLFVVCTFLCAETPMASYSVFLWQSCIERFQWMTAIIQEAILKTNFGLTTFPELYVQDMQGFHIWEKDCDV